MSNVILSQAFKGVNRVDSAHALSESESPDAVNCGNHQGVAGVIGPRLGRKHVTLHSNRILGVIPFNLPNQRFRIIAGNDGQWIANAVTWPSLIDYIAMDAPSQAAAYITATWSDRPVNGYLTAYINPRGDGTDMTYHGVGLQDAFGGFTVGAAYDHTTTECDYQVFGANFKATGDTVIGYVPLDGATDPLGCIAGNLVIEKYINDSGTIAQTLTGTVAITVRFVTTLTSSPAAGTSGYVYATSISASSSELVLSFA